MGKLILTIKTFCLLIIFNVCFSGIAEAQVLLHEGFEGDSLAGKTFSLGKSKWARLGGGYNSYKGKVCAYVTVDNYNEKTNCWLIMDPLKFEAGRKYSISFYYKCQSNQDNQLQVTISKKFLASASDIVWDKSFHNDSYLKGRVNFTPSATGNQYIGFHCVTPNMVTYLYLDEITVEEVSCFEPLNISFTNPTSTSIVAGWDKVDGAAYYEYSLFKKDTSIPKKINIVTDTTVSLTGLPPATANYFYVRSRCSKTDSSSWAISKFSTNYDCSTFPTMNCGDLIKKSYTGGTGLYPVILCNEAVNGPEFFHKFTAPKSGYYKLDCFSSGGNGVPVSFSYKPSSDGCGNSNWTCIGIMVDYSLGVFGPLKAGEEYIIMEKSELEATFQSSYSFKIECYNPPPVNDNCKNATAITVSDYTDNCTGTPLTTLGATPDNLGFDDYNSCGSFSNSHDDDIWIKFKATDNVQLFRFSNVNYTGKSKYLEVNFYSSPCNADSLVDCGEIRTGTGDTSKDILSYYFTKGKTYWCRISTIGIDNYANFNLCIMKAAVAGSAVDTCKRGLRQPTQDKDKNVWVPMLDKSLKLVGAVYFGDNTGSSVSPFVFINHGNLRQDATGRYYLDRNFTLLSQPKITAPIKVRLYISNGELNRLTAQGGSEATSIKDIRITQTDGSCSPLGNKTGTYIIPDKTGDYDADDKYIEFKTDHLSSFFLHGGTTALNSKPATVSNASAAMLNKPLIVSPNPFTNSINIQTTETASAEYTISVVTMNGEVLSNFKKIVIAGNSSLNLNLSALSSGVYILKIEKPDGVEFKKIIKQ